MIQHIFKLKKAALFTILALLMAGMSANAQEVITLQKAVDLALQNNLTIKQAQFTEALANEDYKQAKNNLLPSVTVNPQGSYNFGRSPNLS